MSNDKFTNTFTDTADTKGQLILCISMASLLIFMTKI